MFGLQVLVIESRAGGAVTFDISTVGETALVFTPAAAVTKSSYYWWKIAFVCYTTGTWNIAYKLGGAGAATDWCICICSVIINLVWASAHIIKGKKLCQTIQI